MSNQHPITPPPELVKEWADSRLHNSPQDLWRYIALLAAQWGADQELEACVEWLGDAPVVWNNNKAMHPGSFLREARRPTPPSLAEMALEALDYSLEYDVSSKYELLRRALERLKELEGGDD